MYVQYTNTQRLSILTIYLINNPYATVGENRNFNFKLGSMVPSLRLFELGITLIYKMHYTII